MSDIYKLLTVFLFTFLIYNCGVMQQEEEYYPLDAGMSWEYNATFKYPIIYGGNINTVMKVVNFPKRTFEQGEAVPRKYTLKNPDNPGEVIFFEFIGIDEEGIFIYGEQSANIPELQVLGYRNYFIKHSLKVGDYWQCNHENHNSRGSLVSMETITVPAGNFDNCLKIKEEGVRELKKDDTYWSLIMRGDEGSAKIQYESTCWYAPGVGMVKFYVNERLLRGGRQERWDYGRIFGETKKEMQLKLISYNRKWKRQTLKRMPLRGEKKKEKFAINEVYITPEVLGKNVLHALRKRDIDHFMNFVVKQKDVEELIEVVPQHTKRQLKDGIQKLPEILESIRKTFFKISERGIKNGIKWELTKFESVKYKVMKDSVIEGSDIYMIFSYKGICYKVQIDDCIKTKRGWLNTDGIRWSGKEENSSSQRGEVTAVEPKTITAQPRFRSQPTTLSQDELKTMFKKYDFFGYFNKKGHGFANKFEVQTFKGDTVVLDHAAGLMWQQGGSPDTINFVQAKQFVEKINRRGYAGYNDWRLPTLEEAMSLMERDRKNYLYINNLFDKKQIRIWTSDLVKGASWPWVVYFNFGRHNQDAFCTKYLIRVIRSVHAQ